MRRLDAVLFDFDNTLVETETPWFEVWRDIFAYHRLPLTRATWIDMMAVNANPAEVMERNFGVRMTTHDQRRLVARVMNKIQSLPPMPGAIPLLDACRRSGVVAGLATNGSRQWLDQCLPRCLAERIDFVRTIDDVPPGCGKPLPYIHQMLLADIGTDARHAVGIEDSRVGVEAVRAAGMQCVLVPSGPTRNLRVEGAIRRNSLSDVSIRELERMLPAFDHQLVPAL